MFNKRTKLALALAATVFSAAASAQVNITPVAPATVAPATYASELDVSGGVALTHAGIVFNSPIAINVDTLRYVRIDISGAEFSAIVAAGITTAAGAVVNIVQGGNGSTTAIYSIDTAAAPVTAADTITINFGSLEVSDQTGVSVTVGVYETQTLADAGGDPLGDAITGATVLGFASGLDIDFTPGANLIADVEAATPFGSFLSNPVVNPAVDTGVLGTVQLALAANILDADGSAIALADLVTSWTVSVAGNFDFANSGTIATPAFVIGTNANPSVGAFTITNTAPIGVNATLTASTATSTAQNAVDTLTFAVDGAGVDVFTDSEYVATVNITAPATNTAAMAFTVPVSVSGSSGTIGTIERNGTNVEIPFLSTFSSLNQRVYIVNRGSSDAMYAFTFTSESDATTVAGTAATGTAPGNTTTVLRATDIVTVTGKTRTAASLSVVAPQSDIDIATSIVDTDNGSTDTVVLKP